MLISANAVENSPANCTSEATVDSHWGPHRETGRKHNSVAGDNPPLPHCRHRAGIAFVYARRFRLKLANLSKSSSTKYRSVFRRNSGRTGSSKAESTPVKNGTIPAADCR